LETFTVYEQRQPLVRNIKGSSEKIYEANLVEVCKLEANSADEALDIAKKRGLANWPVIWGPSTEAKRDRYNKKPRYHED
jgi:hypothetical protein